MMLKAHVVKGKSVKCTNHTNHEQRNKCRPKKKTYNKKRNKNTNDIQCLDKTNAFFWFKKTNVAMKSIHL